MNLGHGDPIQNRGKKISETKKRINTKLIKFVIEPYIEVLNNKGLGGIVYKDFRKHLLSELVHVVAQYKEKLSPRDVLNILIMALDDEYLKSIGKSTNIYSIFFNRNLSIVERYLRQKNVQKIFRIKNNDGIIQPIEEYGHFVFQNNKFIHVPPTNELAQFYEIIREVENRLSGIGGNPKFDDLFSGIFLKPEELWRIGSSGTNNKFVAIN